MYARQPLSTCSSLRAHRPLGQDVDGACASVSSVHDKRQAIWSRPSGSRDPASALHTEDLKMIGRVWHGWTSPANADAYEALLKSEIFQGIQDRQITGYRGIHLLRRDLGDEVEFVTIMWFESIDAVRTFAGEDYEAAVVPPRARELLARFDARSQHYEVKVEMDA